MGRERGDWAMGPECDRPCRIGRGAGHEALTHCRTEGWLVRPPSPMVQIPEQVCPSLGLGCNACRPGPSACVGLSWGIPSNLHTNISHRRIVVRPSQTPV